MFSLDVSVKGPREPHFETLKSASKITFPSASTKAHSQELCIKGELQMKIYSQHRWFSFKLRGCQYFWLGIFLYFCLFGVSQRVGINESQAACSYIKYQVHRVHMQSSFFAHCRSKAQLGYRRVPSSEALYQSQYLVSCINGCCAEPSDSTGHWRQSQGQPEKAPVSISVMKNTHLIDLPVQVKEWRRTCVIKGEDCPPVCARWRVCLIGTKTDPHRQL